MPIEAFEAWEDAQKIVENIGAAGCIRRPFACVEEPSPAGDPRRLKSGSLGRHKETGRIDTFQLQKPALFVNASGVAR